MTGQDIVRVTRYGPERLQLVPHPFLLRSYAEVVVPITVAGGVLLGAEGPPAAAEEPLEEGQAGRQLGGLYLAAVTGARRLVVVLIPLRPGDRGEIERGREIEGSVSSVGRDG
jgi:hypothetical protein